MHRVPRLALLLIPVLLIVLAQPWSGLQLPSSIGRASPSCLPSEPPAALPLPTAAPDAPHLRVVTYNLHSGLGPRWRLFASRDLVEHNLRRIGRAIASAAPPVAPVDVVGLNEVDFAARRSGGFDQAAFLAAELEKLTGYSYTIVRGETWRREIPGLEVRFGNALLVRHRIIRQQACRLGVACTDTVAPPPVSGGAGWFGRRIGEQRGVVRARIDFSGTPLDLLLTHLEAIVLDQREGQAAEILQRFIDPTVPTVLLGDLNAVPTGITAERPYLAADRTHDIITGGPLMDARSVLEATGRGNWAQWATFPADAPRWPLDAILASSRLLPRRAGVLGGAASDHRGLFIEYQWLHAPQAQQLAAWHEASRRSRLTRVLACDLAASTSDARRLAVQRLGRPPS